MEKSVRPDKKYFIKIVWILVTVTVFVILITGIIHLIIRLNQGNQEAIFIIWFAAIAALFLMWLFTIPVAHLWIKNLAYIIREDGIKIQKGIITKLQQNIPYRAVTDFALERTLYDRILGIGSIKIQTAGQSHSPTGYEGKLAGLTDYEDWHNDLRERVRSLLPLSESITTAETARLSDKDLLMQILAELKEIRKNTAKK